MPGPFGPTCCQEALVLTFDFYHRADHLVLSVSGELDLESSQPFRQRLADLTGQGQLPLLIDLSGLRFVDSSGLGALLATVRLPEERRPRIVLTPTDHPVNRLLRTTRMDSLLRVYPSVEAALGSAAVLSAV
jgi:anti-sigma B factor antagonist